MRLALSCRPALPAMVPASNTARLASDGARDQLGYDAP
jgi:hypothetical protein